MMAEDVLAEIAQFLKSETPDEWIKKAIKTQDVLLVDHANCEKKAANTAMSLLFKHLDKYDLLKKMSQLAREELLHFEQVIAIMKQRKVDYRNLSSSGYSQSLRAHVRPGSEGQLIDVLIIGALIEARSCERFAKLAPYLDDDLAKFYRSLLKSEGRHYQDYLDLAKKYASSETNIEERINFFRIKEAELICAPDSEFRFHSGVPIA
jgi:tRNA-(ms[2]io[6]A)-hydroxylase